jgi:hypothetical protein
MKVELQILQSSTPRDQIQHQANLDGDLRLVMLLDGFFNAGRANWIGVAMFVISIPVFVWWTRKYTKLLLRRSA